ncbi:hypothetical protein ACWDSJ_36285 [Nocardia sp. NPDC003482]
MNVEHWQEKRPSPDVWEHPDMRRALAVRNFAKVFTILKTKQFSQRAILRLTNLSSATFHAIVREGRDVKDIEVLTRIADGLGFPRGYIGLAYDGTTQRLLLDPATARSHDASADQREVQDLLAYASTVATGSNPDDDGHRWWREASTGVAVEPPDQVGLHDVASLKTFIADMRRMDYQFGGGSCLEPITAQVGYVEQILRRSDYRGEVGVELCSAAADLHNLAGWTSMDVGHYSRARQHFRRALALAREIDDHSLLSNIFYRTGRLHLHQQKPKTALRFFQLGQLTARDSGCPLTVSMLCANEAWAYAVLGNRSQAMQSLHRAGAEFDIVYLADAAEWVRFFGEADLHAMFGVTMTACPDASVADLDTGIAHITAAIELRGDCMARSRAFEYADLATAHLRNGDRAECLEQGTKAIAAAGRIRSMRALDRLVPLRAAAARRSHDAELQEQIVNRIGALRVRI